MTLLHIAKRVYSGQSIARAYMNEALRNFSIRGKTLDVGGARKPDYFSYLTVAPGTSIEVVDGVISSIDFEKDTLPYGDGSYESVISCNVLEHIFNHRFLLSEMHRVLRKDGVFVGFVPFLIHVHPDPHDYFRYTGETLERLLFEAGFRGVSIIPVGEGPFLVGCNTVIQGLPKIIRPPLFLLSYGLDRLFAVRKGRESTRARFPLGYVFSGRK